MQITENMSVADIAAALPSSVRVFEEHGVDFCCGGKKPIGVVCEEQGLSFPELASEIAASTATAAPDDREWAQEPLSALIAHIIRAYHDPLRAELPRLQALASKVAQVHGPNAAHLIRVEEVVDELSSDMMQHMEKEELVLFPAIRAVESGDDIAAVEIAMPVGIMEQEHDRAGALLAELRRITDAYVTPAWGCNTFRTLYRELEQFEASMHQHVHLENNILFPRALRRAAA